MAIRDNLVFYLNGIKKTVMGDAAFAPLSSYLRYDRALTGTKVVCAEGDCGACAVLIAFPGRPNPTKFASPFRLVNSCILPVTLIDGASLVTIEGMQASDGSLSEIQKRMVECHGSQCGFCTPGFVMAIGYLYEQYENCDSQKVKNCLTGNLCRCTGYDPIVRAAMAVDRKQLVALRESYLTTSIEKELKAVAKTPFRIEGEAKVAHGPTQPKDVGPLIKGGKVRIVSSATDLGVVHNKEKLDLFQTVTLAKVPELFELKETKAHTEVGAGVDLETLRRFTKASYPEFSRFLNLFASPPIRNAATLVGNIANASPIADTIPFLLVMEAELEIQGGRAKRKVPLTSFYKGYKKMDLKAGEWISKVLIPRTRTGEVVRLYKVSQRRDLDIATVNAAFYVTEKGKVRVAYGGVGPTAMRVGDVESHLSSDAEMREKLTRARESLQKAIHPISDMRSSEAYRRKVSDRLLQRFVAEVGLP